MMLDELAGAAAERGRRRPSWETTNLLTISVARSRRPRPARGDPRLPLARGLPATATTTAGPATSTP